MKGGSQRHLARNTQCDAMQLQSHQGQLAVDEAPYRQQRQSWWRRAYRRGGFEVAIAGFALLYLFVFAGLPLIYNIVLSVQQVDLLGSDSFVRPFVGLANYVDVISR